MVTQSTAVEALIAMNEVEALRERALYAEIRRHVRQRQTHADQQSRRSWVWRALGLAFLAKLMNC